MKRVCHSCGGMVISGPYGSGTVECHNDQCEINREPMRQREAAESAAAGVRLGRLTLQLAFGCAVTAGALYGFWMLVTGGRGL